MEIKLHQKEKQKNRLSLTDENVMLEFSYTGISEDTNEVCENVKPFIVIRQVSANYDLYISTSSCYQSFLVSKEGMGANLVRFEKNYI